MYVSRSTLGYRLLPILPNESPSKKMAKASFTDLLPEAPYNPLKSDEKREKLIECVLTGNSKQYLGRAYTEEQINKLSAKEVDKLFSRLFTLFF